MEYPFRGLRRGGVDWAFTRATRVSGGASRLAAARCGDVSNPKAVSILPGCKNVNFPSPWPHRCRCPDASAHAPIAPLSVTGIVSVEQQFFGKLQPFRYDP